MTENQNKSDAAMAALMQNEVFTEKEFYERLGGHDIAPRQLINLWKEAVRNHLKVGYIERCIGGYRKVVK